MTEVPRGGQPTRLAMTLWNLAGRRIVVGMLLALSLAAVLAAILVAGCDSYNSQHGRSDAPISNPGKDNRPAEVISMPDGYRNLATKCDGHGHRLYMTSTEGDKQPQIAVVDDASCPGGAAK